MNQNSFFGLIEQSVRTHWEMPAMTDFRKTYCTKIWPVRLDQLTTI